MDEADLTIERLRQEVYALKEQNMVFASSHWIRTAKQMQERAEQAEDLLRKTREERDKLKAQLEALALAGDVKAAADEVAKMRTQLETTLDEQHNVCLAVAHAQRDACVELLKGMPVSNGVIAAIKQTPIVERGKRSRKPYKYRNEEKVKDALREVAEKQREACAEYLKHWTYDEHALSRVRATPLVTES